MLNLGDMFVGLFTLFSPLYCIWKIYTIKKTKLYSFRGRILAQVLNCNLCLCDSGRITAVHSSSFPSFLYFFSSFCFIKNYLLNHILHQALFWCDQLYEIQRLLLFSLYRWGNRSLERLSFLPTNPHLPVTKIWALMYFVLLPRSSPFIS